MPKKVFISYKHEPKEWVKKRLVPCLEAGGAEVIIDYKHFQAGQSVIGQMDKYHDRADLSILVFSPDYLTSPYCLHEMNRAIAQDPQFQNGKVLPVIRESCTLPAPFQTNPPLWIDLTDDKLADKWDLLFQPCDVNLGCSAPDWLTARDELVRCLRRHESVNMVVRNHPRWRELLNQVRTDLSLEHGIQLAQVDLAAGSASTLTGLIEDIIKACGGTVNKITKTNALLSLDRFCSNHPNQIFLAILHFDLIVRENYYDDLFFAALRNLVTEKKKLVLLLESREHFANLVPRNHPLSALLPTNIELGGRP